MTPTPETLRADIKDFMVAASGWAGSPPSELRAVLEIGRKVLLAVVEWEASEQARQRAEAVVYAAQLVFDYEKPPHIRPATNWAILRDALAALAPGETKETP